MNSSSTSSWRVCAAQTGAVAPDGVAAMAAQARQWIALAGQRGFDLMVFPELFLTPFFANAPDAGAQRYFMRLDEEPMRGILAEVSAARVNAVIPFAERSDTGFHNSACVVDRWGDVRGIYRKTHLPAYFPNAAPGGTGSYEKLFFQPGDQLPIFELDGIRIGVLICYDRLFPEASRSLALRGAQMIAMPISYSGYSDPGHRGSIWDVPIRARAYENGVYVVAANRVGEEGPRVHIGRSLIVDPLGATLQEGPSDDEAMLWEHVDFTRLLEIRYKAPFWRDRRPDLYATT